MNMASRIKQRMSELQLTQESVAHRAGISQGMVYKLLSGKAKSTSKLIELAQALECDVNWLATGHNELREQPAEYNSTSLHNPERFKKEFSRLPTNIKKTLVLELVESMINDK